MNQPQENVQTFSIIGAVLQAIRPVNVLFSGVCTLAAGYIAMPTAQLSYWAAAVVMLAAAAGYIVNDIFDLPIDRINKP